MSCPVFLIDDLKGVRALAIIYFQPLDLKSEVSFNMISFCGCTMLCLLMCQSSGSMSQKPLLQTYILFWHLSTFCFPGKPFLKCTLLFPLSRAHGMALVLLPFEITLLRPLGTSMLPNKMHVLQSLVYVTSLEHLALLNTHRFRNLYLCLALL